MITSSKSSSTHTMHVTGERQTDIQRKTTYRQTETDRQTKIPYRNRQTDNRQTHGDKDRQVFSDWILTSRHPYRIS